DASTIAVILPARVVVTNLPLGAIDRGWGDTSFRFVLPGGGAGENHSPLRPPGIRPLTCAFPFGQWAAGCGLSYTLWLARSRLSGGAATAVSTLMRRRTIAIVDDEPGMLAALSDVLQAHGFDTNVFSSAEDWLAHGASTPPDVLVLDIHLGGISGIELQ